MDLKEIHSFLTAKLNEDSLSSLESTHRVVESLSEVDEGFTKVTTTSNLYRSGDCLIETGVIFKFINDISIPAQIEHLQFHFLPQRLPIRNVKNTYMILITHIPGISEAMPVQCERPWELPEVAKQKLLQDIDLLLEKRLALANLISSDGLRTMHYVPTTQTIIFNNPDIVMASDPIAVENYLKNVKSLLYKQ